MCCAQALQEVVSVCFGRSGVTESDFQLTWMQTIERFGELTGNGWYCPPPLGAAVLCATIAEPQRISFRSLRDEANFPSSREIVWPDGLLFTYCSNLHKPLLMPSDFSTILYFGHDPKYLEYFQTASQAARHIAEISLEMTSSRQLFRAGEKILRLKGLANTVHSVSDVTPLDYGHSLNRINASALDCDIPWAGNELREEVCKHVSTSRMFINNVADWRLDEVDAYTVEPQIVSLDDPSLPKVTFHYLVTQTHGRSVEASIEMFLPKKRACLSNLYPAEMGPKEEYYALNRQSR
jgi:hypothetical protein